MDWAVNLPHRSPQTHSLCHWYPEAEAASFPPFPREHWQVKGLDKSYIWLSFQISHHEGVLLYLSLSRSLLALFSMNTNGTVPLTKSQASSRPSPDSVNILYIWRCEECWNNKFCETSEWIKKILQEHFCVKYYFQVKIIEILLIVHLTLIWLVLLFKKNPN